MTMTGDRRNTTKRLQALSASASALAILLAAGGMMAVTATPALAACTPNPPASGQTVTCDTTPSDPDPNGIIAPGSDNVTVNIESGAGIETIGPAIELGLSATINNQGTVETTGNNAAALSINSGGPYAGVVSQNQINGGQFSTQGNDSTAIFIDELGDNSALISEIQGVTIGTQGDGSIGLFHGGVGASALLRFRTH